LAPFLFVTNFHACSKIADVALSPSIIITSWNLAMASWLPQYEELINTPGLLESTLARYGRLLDGAGYAFWEWHLSDGSYQCTGSFWEKLGYKKAFETVTSPEMVQEYIHPDDFGYVYNVVVKHLRDDTPINMVYRIRAADGTYCWTQACASSTRDINGRVTYLTGVNFDLSHLKETEKALRMTEARYERILAASNDGIWEWSAIDGNTNPKKAGRVGNLHTSYSFWKHLGYTDEEVDALPEQERASIWHSHVHPYDFQRWVEVMRRHYKTREPFDIEYRMFGEKGKMFWMRSRGHSIFNTYGRAIMMSGINIDITELKESEERVRHAKEEAELANKSKTNFLSSMSHELRTPLNAILGFSRLMSSDETLSDGQRENAHYVHDAGRHLLRLINDVLDLAQIESGKLSLSMEQLQPAKMVEESFNYCKASAEERNISFHFETGDLSEVYISVDPIRLRQCLLNLIHNAIKYNIDGGHIDVTFLEVKGDLEIAVKDTGPGIPAEKQGSLFEMFNRLGAERSSIEGSGIGLVISRELAMAMDGDLIYHDDDTPGACFKLYFPIVNRMDQEQETTSALLAETKKTLDIKFSTPKNVFYIEDNISNIRLLESWLKPYSQVIFKTQIDPMLGLYEVRKNLPDMILLDINLPEISGYDILKILKQDPLTKQLPVVAISASAMESDIKKGLEVGFDAYLTKPLDIDKLSGVFNHYFSGEPA
jgi:PAS domain S-box-containing protein